MGVYLNSGVKSIGIALYLEIKNDQMYKIVAKE